MRNFDCEEELGFSGLFDQGAEVFTKKMFRHSQAKAQENWNDLKKDQRSDHGFEGQVPGFNDLECNAAGPQIKVAARPISSVAFRPAWVALLGTVDQAESCAL